ncbi:hypothetical protein GCM10009789_66530 [Kribbella sancticallisti]|uniref:Anti-sigma factor antagonist n=1 Tax=Kribbella sancticallisti TaxID=460087 RepID=A0ABP4QB05_9ACTN
MLEEDAEFSLVVDTTGPGPLVRVRGDLDLETAPELTETLKTLVGPHLLVVDLTEVEFMDSSGLGVLVGAHKESEASGGALAVVGAQVRVQKILRITKLHKVFTLYPTLDDLNAELAQAQVAHHSDPVDGSGPPSERGPQ